MLATRLRASSVPGRPSVRVRPALRRRRLPWPLSSANMLISALSAAARLSHQRSPLTPDDRNFFFILLLSEAL